VTPPPSPPPAAATSVRTSMPSNPENDPPGVPGFRTWRGVYLFVFAVFVLLVIGLTLFTRAYA
jgi:hypothetical protein